MIWENLGKQHIVSMPIPLSLEHCRSSIESWWYGNLENRNTLVCSQISFGDSNVTISTFSFPVTLIGLDSGSITLPSKWLIGVIQFRIMAEDEY